MSVLACDPSIGNFGWAVLNVLAPNRVAMPARVDSGTWRPSSAKGASDRYDQLAWFLSGLFPLHGLEHVVIEVPSGGQRHSATQLMAYARAIGVAEAVAAINCRPAVRVPVNTWKGNARKSFTALTVKAELRGYEPGDDNEADALGVGLWWLGARSSGYRAEVEKLLRRA